MHLETTWQGQQWPGYGRKWSEIAFVEKQYFDIQLDQNHFMSGFTSYSQIAWWSHMMNRPKCPDMFWGWMSKHQTTGWKHIRLEALERGTHNPLNSDGLWNSHENIRTLFIHHVKRLRTVFEGHYSDPKAHDESFWNLWWPRAPPKDLKLCKVGKNQQKPISLCPPTSSQSKTKMETRR